MTVQKEEEGEEGQHTVVTLFTSNCCTCVDPHRVDKTAKYLHQLGWFFFVSDDNNTVAACSTWTAGRANVYHTHKKSY